MVVFSRIMQVLGGCNFVIGVALTIYGYILPNKIEGGTYINIVGLIFVTFSLFLMLILTGVHCFIIGNDRAENLIDFNIRNSILYVIVGVNLVYRLFFGDFSRPENGTSLTGAKLMAGLAISLLINLSVAIMATNYLKEGSS